MTGLTNSLSLSIFMNDLPNYLECKNSGYVRLNDYKLRCLLYADDIVLMSESQQGLQRSLDLLAAYCKGWQLVVNIKKKKIIVFHKRFQENLCFTLNNQRLEVIKTQTYLGIVLSYTGSFKPAIANLYSKASKAYHSLRREFNFHNVLKLPRVNFQES